MLPVSQTRDSSDAVPVSVVVPLYQKAATVRRCLESIARQTLASFEAIVVDDGSTDGGGDAVADLGDRRFRLVRQANAGPGAARNRGIAEARAQHVAFLDADDAWDETYLERMVACLEANPGALASVCSFRTATGSLVPRWRRANLADGPLRIGTHTDHWTIIELIAMLSPCTTVARRDALIAAGGFYEHGCRYGEDGFLAFKLVFGGTIEVLVEDLVTVDEGSSALSVRRQTRPLEPIYADAAELRCATPVALRSLFDDIMAERAGKAACVMAFWGRHREAVKLVGAFVRPRDLRRKWPLLGYLAASPAGFVAALAVRQLTGAR